MNSFTINVTLQVTYICFDSALRTIKCTFIICPSSFAFWLYYVICFWQSTLLTHHCFLVLLIFITKYDLMRRRCYRGCMENRTRVYLIVFSISCCFTYVHYWYWHTPNTHHFHSQIQSGVKNIFQNVVI